MARLVADFLPLNGNDMFDMAGEMPPQLRVHLNVPPEFDESYFKYDEAGTEVEKRTFFENQDKLKDILIERYRDKTTQQLRKMRQGKNLSNVGVYNRIIELETGVTMQYASLWGREYVTLTFAEWLVRRLLQKTSPAGLCALILYRGNRIAAIPMPLLEAKEIKGLSVVHSVKLKDAKFGDTLFQVSQIRTKDKIDIILAPIQFDKKKQTITKKTKHALSTPDCKIYVETPIHERVLPYFVYNEKDKELYTPDGVYQPYKYPDGKVELTKLTDSYAVSEKVVPLWITADGRYIGDSSFGTNNYLASYPMQQLVRPYNYYVNDEVDSYWYDMRNEVYSATAEVHYLGASKNGEKVVKYKLDPTPVNGEANLDMPLLQEESGQKYTTHKELLMSYGVNNTFSDYVAGYSFTQFGGAVEGAVLVGKADYATPVYFAPYIYQYPTGDYWTYTVGFSFDTFKKEMSRITYRYDSLVEGEYWATMVHVIDPITGQDYGLRLDWYSDGSVEAAGGLEIVAQYRSLIGKYNGKPATLGKKMAMIWFPKAYDGKPYYTVFAEQQTMQYYDYPSLYHHTPFGKINRTDNFMPWLDLSTGAVIVHGFGFGTNMVEKPKDRFVYCNGQDITDKLVRALKITSAAEIDAIFLNFDLATIKLFK